MFCPKCGTQVPEGSKFCPACGTDLHLFMIEPDDNAKPTEAATTDKAEPVEVAATAEEAATPDNVELAEVAEPTDAADTSDKAEQSEDAQTSELDGVVDQSGASDQAEAVDDGLTQESAAIDETVFNPAVHAVSSENVAPTGEYATDDMPNEDAPVDASTGVAPKKHGKKRTVIIVLVILFLVAAAAGGFYYWQDHQRHLPHPVAVQVTADNYGAEDSGISVHVTGKDLDGKKVDQDGYVHSDGTGLSLPAGSYQVSVTASPLTDDGTLFAVPTDTISVDISSEVAAGSGVDSGQAIVLTAIAPRDITEDQIQAAYDAAGDDDAFDQSKRDDYRDVVETIYQAHRMRDITFAIDADSYGPEDSGIPVHVTGTDLDGAGVDTTGYVYSDGTGLSSDGTGLSLMPGSYSLAVTASPLTDDGTVFGVPSDAIAFDVPQDSDADSPVNTGAKISLSAIDAASVPDDAIAAAYDAANGDPNFDTTQSDSYRDAATSKRDQAIEAAAEAEAAAREAANENLPANQNPESVRNFTGETFTLSNITLKADDNGNAYFEATYTTTRVDSNKAHYWARIRIEYGDDGFDFYAPNGYGDKDSVANGNLPWDASGSVTVTFTPEIGFGSDHQAADITSWSIEGGF